MKRDELLAVLRPLLAQPTAPFHEGAVRDEILRQLEKLPHVSVRRDGFGNLIAEYGYKTKATPRWAFAAHMDHPGWVREKDGEMRFLGSVAEKYLRNPKRKEYGDFAMWDLPACEIRGGHIYSRACDDLLGCAEIICLFRSLEAGRAEVACLGLFTRAEEVGFVGAIKLAKAGIVPKKTAIFSLETSTPRGTARMGAGPIVRVGDKLSIFDGPATAQLLEIAQREKVPVQRCLLDGGSCEATAYQLYGYRCVAASLALGNYHNITPNESIATEFVALDDYANMVRLIVSTVLTKGRGTDSQRALRQRLEKNAASYRRFYRRL